MPNPAGTREVYFSLQSQNPNVVGFSGCNRMFGHYALAGEQLKFDQIGGTKMFCDVRMELEQRFLADVRVRGRVEDLRQHAAVARTRPVARSPASKSRRIQPRRSCNRPARLRRLNPAFDHSRG